MAKKVWYEIELTDLNNSESHIIAKVKSKGLAHIVYNNLKEVYNRKDDLLKIK